MAITDDGVVAEILEAWRTNHRINLYLIERITDEGWHSTLSTRGGRDVGRQFAHMHDVRVWTLINRAKDLVGDLVPFASKETPPRGEVAAALQASCEGIARFLAAVAAGEPKRRGMKKGVISHLSYLVAHESHHRGSILLTLTTSGHKLPQADAYAIWNWDRM